MSYLRPIGILTRRIRDHQAGPQQMRASKDNV